MNKVVISGIGPICALGTGQECFAEALLGGECGILPIANFATDNYPVKDAAVIEDFDVEEFLPTPKNYLDRQTELSFAAFSLGLADAGIDLASIDLARAALIWAGTYAGTDTINRFFTDIQKKGPRFGKPILFPHTYANTAISLLSIEYGLNGPHMQFSSGWNTSALGVSYAFDLICSGKSGLVFCGGAEAFSETLFRYLLGQDYLAVPDEKPGVTAGEGGAMLVLEDEAHAQERNARIYGELAGCGMTHSPGGINSAAVRTAMEKALVESNCETDGIDAILLNAGGLPQVDRAEFSAIESLFGPEPPPVTALKSLLGETFGISGMLAFIAGLTSLKREAVPLTLNLENLTPGLENQLVKDELMEIPLNRVMINNLDPGGSVVSLVIQKV